MLLANMAVARKINSEYPDKALLRRHPPPQEKMVENLVCLTFFFDSLYRFSVAMVKPIMFEANSFKFFGKTSITYYPLLLNGMSHVQEYSRT